MLANLKNNIQEGCYDAKAYWLLVTAATLPSLEPQPQHVSKVVRKCDLRGTDTRVLSL